MIKVKKREVVNPDKFDEMYDIIENDADLFSELEEDKSIKFEKIIKRKKA